MNCVATNEVTKHLGIAHPESMKVIDYFREQKYVRLRERKSSGLNGYGYDGSLFAELTPTEQGVMRVMKYLRSSYKSYE